MDKLISYFPLSGSVRSGVMKNLILALVIYLVASAIFGLLHTILGWIPFVGWLIKLLCSLGGLYCVAGMVLAVCQFLRY